MERKLELLETCSSRSQETYPYFVEDNLEQSNFHCWYRVALINIEKNIHTHNLKCLELPRRELTLLNAPPLQALRYCHSA